VGTTVRASTAVTIRGDFGNVDDAYYLATEYLTGRTLEEILDSSKERNQPLGVANALYVATEICKGLEHAHSQKDSKGNGRNIIHRNISPQSIFITDKGNIKITEFGINAAAGQDSSSQMGMFKGKVAYMSPEQVDGKAMDCRSDIFSLGVILYEMVTGKQAFEGETIQVFSRVRQAQFEPPENIVDQLPSELCQIIRRALEKMPEDRFPSATEMGTHIKEVLPVVGSEPTVSTFIQYLEDLSHNKADMGEAAQERSSNSHTDELAKPIDIEPTVKPELEVFDGSRKTHNADQNDQNSVKDILKKESEMRPSEAEEMTSSFLQSHATTDNASKSKDHEPTSANTPPQAPNEEKGDGPVAFSDQNFRVLPRGNAPQAKTTPVKDERPEPAETKNRSPVDAPLQTSLEPPEKAAVDKAPCHEEKKPNTSENQGTPGQKKGKTVLWIAVAAVLAVVCIGTTLFMAKQPSQRGSDKIASSEFGHGLKALENGRFDEAVSLFDQAMASEPALINQVSKPYSEALQGKAAALIKTEPGTAEQLLVQAVSFDPENVSAHSQLGLLYLTKKDYVNAASYYETAVQLGSKSPDTFFNLGYIYAVTQDYTKAEKSYSQVVHLEPSFLDEALFNLAVVQDRLGKRKQCIKNLKLAQKANPKNKQVRQYLKRMKT
jgi:serine/threonine protein kinase/Tfp pilus assembly protein PilF